MQNSFMGSLMELSAKHEEILYLTADSGEGGLDLMYQRNFPNRTFNFGIAEENMVAAAGMALCGKIPFVYTAAPFLAYRSFEFIRDDLCFIFIRRGGKNLMAKEEKANEQLCLNPPFATRRTNICRRRSQKMSGKCYVA